jgi:MYXO-CTERM domain-containing protein
MFALHNSLRAALVAAALLAATPAFAGPITFTFDGTAGGNNTDVRTSMQNTLNANGMGGVTVTVSNALPLAFYDGDGHVVGPVSKGVVTPLTLGTGGNTFIANDGVGATGDRITITFSQPVFAVSFNFQIFPDGTYKSETPDFSFAANGVTVYSVVAGVPGDGGQFSSTFPNSNFSLSAHLPNEPVPQYIGSYSVNFFNQGQTKLEFIDWPQRIGISNLTVDFADPPPPPPPSVPEPTSVLAWGLGLAVLAGAAARRARRAQPAL